MSSTDRIELERAWDQLQKATARISDLESQLASLTEENERLRDEMEMVGPPPSATQLREALIEHNRLRDALASERARATMLEKHVADTLDDLVLQCDDLQTKLSEERARADRNRDENLSTIKDLAEAEQRAAALDQKLRAVRTAFLDGRLMDLGEILDNPNPESETDDG